MPSSLCVSQSTTPATPRPTPATSTSREDLPNEDDPDQHDDSVEQQDAPTIPAEQQSLDFIGSSHAVKDLFSLPYALDRPVSVAFHNLGGTLLIDAEHGNLNYPQEESVDLGQEKLPIQRETGTIQSDQSFANQSDGRHEPPHKSDEVSTALVALSSLELESDALAILNTAIEASRNKDVAVLARQDTQVVGKVLDNTDNQPLSIPHPDDYIRQYLPALPEPLEYLNWTFHGMGLLVGSDALILRSPETALTVRVEQVNELKALLQEHEERKESGQFLPDHEHDYMRQRGKPSYAEATRRSFPPSETSIENLPKEDQSAQGGPLNNGFSAPDLAQVRLQTCIVAAPNAPVGGFFSGHAVTAREDVCSDAAAPRSPVSAILDIYLDNIMANVPQLALCLQEKGFVQSVKLMQTDEIPSGLLTSRTLDTSTPFDVVGSNPQAEKMFSPKIMETNASTLLRFLKTNCSRDNATYLLRREAGQANIQLYDITTISTQRQRKWVWWLAMMSYRFANRLRHVSESVQDPVLRRNCRSRQRSLLQNTLDLLEVLADMNGHEHESLVAAVCENLADTFLVLEREEATVTSSSDQSSPLKPATSVAPINQPYGGVAVDALNKAQDHLKQGIRALEPVLQKMVKNCPISSEACRNDTDDNSELLGKGRKRFTSSMIRRIEPVVTQLFGMHHKFVNVSLRLAEIHLRNYYSSSAMQAVRASARTLAASLYLSLLLEEDDDDDRRVKDWHFRIQLQYTWLWEHCGHFARSFAADELWRDRGHASGDDVSFWILLELKKWGGGFCSLRLLFQIISVLQDAENAFRNEERLRTKDNSVCLRFTDPTNSLADKSNNLVNLHSLSGVVSFHAPLGSKGTKSHHVNVAADSESVLETARQVLDAQRVILRDKRRVLVAASIAYHRAIQSFQQVTGGNESSGSSILSDSTLLRLLHQRLGDACNETGKMLLNEVRLLLTSGSEASKNLEGCNLNEAAGILLSSSQFWFFEALAAFEECQDLRNLALLRCNLCQSYKFRANSMFAPKGTNSSVVNESGPTHAEICLQEAANHLQAAHESLGERGVDPLTWDMVSDELAATFLVLGVRRRQSLIGSSQSVPVIMQALRLSPGKESSIVDPMERARIIYQQLANFHQAAACHYQLALYYSKIWTCQLNEIKTREKLAAAFEHYGAAHAYFANAVRGNEVTFCLLCIDYSSLYSVVSGEESTRKALALCLGAATAFSQAAIDCALEHLATRSEWFRQMDTVASSLEDTVFKMLRTLVKLEDECGPSSSVQPTKNNYKEWYRTGLRSKMSAASTIPSPVKTGDEAIDRIIPRLLALHSILISMQDASSIP